MNLTEILKVLPLTATLDYGSIIGFDHILEASKLYGLDNSHIIEAQLKELEKQGLLTIQHMIDPGYEDLIIGVKLNS